MADQLHSTASGLDLHEDKRIKAPVKVASTANVNISSPGGTMDSVSLTNGDRVLLKDQSTASQNGIYVFNGSSSILTRANDAASASDFVGGFKVYVSQGTVNAATYWTFTQSSTIVLATTALTFQKDGIPDPTSTKGDLLVRNSSIVTRLGVGSDGSVLTADSAQATGVKWAAVLTNPMTTLGDLIVGAASGVANRLGIGSQGQVLTVDTTQSLGLKWATPFSNPMTTAQDLIVGGASGAATRLGVGSNNQVLGIVAGVVGWISNPAGFANPMTLLGDLIWSSDNSGTPARLAIGSNGQVLTVVAGQPAWAAATGGGGGSVPDATKVFYASHFN